MTDKDWPQIAEKHAFSVRQLHAQRDRFFQILHLLSLKASFKEGAGSLGKVISAIELTESQFYQDIFCQLLNNGKENGFFVEFGACDGLLINNTWILETKFGWNGILAEPSRYWSEKVKNNRSCVIDTRCVWSTTGENITFSEPTSDKLHTESGILETLTLKNSTSETYEVETVSLNDLLEDHNAPQTIDFISIDTEGSEFDILKNFDFDKYRFDFMSIELYNTEEVEKPIKKLLESAGYKQIFSSISGHDGFFVPDNKML